MFMELYSIKDEKMGVFNPPQPVPHLVEMTRSIDQLLKRDDNKLSKYPGDYALYYVGKFDQDNGSIIIDPSGPRHIANITSFLTPSNSVTAEVPRG